MRLTDTGNAEKLIEQFGGDILYCPQRREWYVWDGRRWKEDVNKTIYQMAKRVARGYTTMAEQYDKEHPIYKSLMKHANSSESLRGIQSMITLAQSDEAVCLSSGDFDRDPMRLCVENGVIDLETIEFRRFDKHDFITLISPVAYNVNAVSQKWLGFLSDILPDKDTRDFLQRAVGYSLTGYAHEGVLFILYGRGQNGKTTFTGTILNMLGDYAAQASSSALMQQRNTGPSNELYVLIGKRFVSAAETSESHRLDENLIKQMTGMDRVSVNPKYKSQIEFTPTWKIWLSTNHEPIILGNDHAIWKRIRKIPFEVTITEAKCDPQLKLALFNDLQERSGILNWALEGVRRWKEDGLKPSKQIIDATRAYRAEQDLVGQFITEQCQIHPALSIYKSRLYKFYMAYCLSMNEKPKQKVAFGYQLRERGVRDDRDRSGRYWIGIGINEAVNLNPKGYEE